MTDLAGVETSVRAAVPVGLFTVLAWIPGPQVLRRVHTSHPREYPVGAEKAVGSGTGGVAAGWARRCVEDRLSYLGPDMAAVRAVFADHRLIASLGCGAVVNVPVLEVWADGGERVLGVLNVLGPEGSYGDPEVLAVTELAPLAVPALREVGT